MEMDLERFGRSFPRDLEVPDGNGIGENSRTNTKARCCRRLGGSSQYKRPCLTSFRVQTIYFTRVKKRHTYHSRPIIFGISFQPFLCFESFFFSK